MTKKDSKAKKGYTKKNKDELLTPEGIEAVSQMFSGCGMAAELGFMGMAEEWVNYIYSVLVLITLNYMLRAGKSGQYTAKTRDTIEDVVLNIDELENLATELIDILANDTVDIGPGADKDITLHKDADIDPRLNN